MHVANPRRWLALVAIMLAFLPVVLGMTILTVAMPTLTLVLGASATEILWIMDIYPLLMVGQFKPAPTSRWFGSEIARVMHFVGARLRAIGGCPADHDG